MSNRKKRGRPRKHDLDVPEQPALTPEQAAKIISQVSTTTAGESLPQRAEPVRTYDRVRVARDENADIEFAYSNSVGRPREYMSDQQKSEFIQIIDAGGGRHLAMKTLKIGKTKLKNTLELDPEFKEALFLAEMSKEDIAEMQIYSAVQAGSVSAAFGYLNQKSSSRRDKQSTLMMLREMKLREELLRKQAGFEGSENRGVDLRKLNRNELLEFERIHTLIRNGVEVSQDDAFHYAKLMGKAMQAQSPEKSALDMIREKRGGTLKRAVDDGEIVEEEDE